jgi:hypothetical protein
MEEFGFQLKAKHWRLFTDSLKLNLKAVLLHNRNKKSSIPIAHATGMEETYNSMCVPYTECNQV